MSAVPAYYAQAAARLRAEYGSVTFENVHAPILEFLPPPGAPVADIGAGVGRDAKALAELGYHVTAVEPSAAMRHHAGLNDRDPSIRWIDDRLPGLAQLISQPERFDFILCAAVLMHLDPADLKTSFRTFTTLMNAGARLATSLRRPRATDAPGVYALHTPQVVIAAADAAGLSLLASGMADDLLSRTDIDWSWFVFEKPATSDGL